MKQTYTTPVPNQLFDGLLSNLSDPELKVLLLVVRQTMGWKCTKTGKRKERDWIAGKQFQQKTGLSRKAISRAIASLSQQGLLRVTDYPGFVLNTAIERKGKTKLFYTAFPKPGYQPPLRCVRRAQILRPTAA